MAENIVEYGLRNVYYSIVTETISDNTVTVSYGTPVALPGAVNLSISQESNRTDFYADDRVYYNLSANNGYTGTLEVARVTDDFLEDVLGFTKDSKNMIAEYKDSQPKAFAMMFEFQGDDSAIRHVLYNVKAERPDVASSTIGESVEVQTATMNITCYPAADTGCIKMKTGTGADSTMYEAWYTAVQLPTVATS